ncbi:hypothetical protein WBG78_07520 [Chryseolinea sp. T2]|uniref:hypothetical protein n=1 Tax=Chryseolinea sp. T2 TaxID=3129255 RepID=UPI0030777A6A
MNSSNKCLLAIAAAAAAGAAIGILFAHESGPQLQTRLKSKSRGWLSRIGPLVGPIVSNAIQFINDSRAAKSAAEKSGTV